MEETNKNIRPVRDSFLMFITPILLFLTGYLAAREFGGQAVGVAAGVALDDVPFLVIRCRRTSGGGFLMKVHRSWTSEPGEIADQAVYQTFEERCSY